MEDLTNDDLNDLKEEFGTEWEQDLLNTAEKTENDFFSENADESNEEDLPLREHLEVLSKCFGHKNFRPMQWKIINSIINKRRDNCAIMTTGYGKSLCYQYPSAYMGGITIIVSPLISLMEDQVLAMKVANISACLLGSANVRHRETIDEIFEDKYSLVYLTPEFSTGENGREFLQKMHDELSITLVAIDEAHCVSSWGHDFRFQYRQLGMFKEIMPDTPILAVTATATHKVRDDICKLLKLRNPQILCTGFDRPNLYFSAHLKGRDQLGDIQKVMERKGGEWKFSGSTIIYCISRKNTEEISCILSDIGIKSLPYHAGLSMSVRKETHEKFVKDKLDVVVATIAFGMGIDKPDIRNIIHYGAPNAIEGYYQEVGRAGRDGLPAKCTTFYANSDFAVHRRLRQQCHGSKESKANREKMADIMLEYLTSRNCRRQFILSYFEDKNLTPPKRSLCCDNCVRKNVQSDSEVFEGLDQEGKYDFTEDAWIFLQAVNALDGKFGMVMYTLFIRGSKNSKISKYLNHRLHGTGKNKSEIWWKGIGDLLLKEKYLENKMSSNSSGFKYFTVHLSGKGSSFLQNIKTSKLITTPTPELIKCLKIKTTAWLGSDVGNSQQQGWLVSREVTNSQQQLPTTSTSNKPVQNEDTEKGDAIKLYKLLLNKRYQIANSLDCMPYLIASNKNLMDMAIQKPVTLDQLKNCLLEGFSEAKILKFGEEFLKIITRSNLNIDTSVAQKKLPMKDLLIKHPITTLGGSAQVSYRHFKDGLTVEEIAKKRGTLVTTVISHLADCIKAGFPIKLIDLGVTDEIKETIINAIKTVDTGLTLLTPIKNACPPDIDFSQVRLVVNYLLVREHLQRLNLEYEDFDDIHGIENISSVSNSDTVESTQPSSPGKLSQLIDAINEVNEMTAGDVIGEDSKFSDDFADADLAAACDILEKSINEKDDHDDQPYPKKLKTEESFGFSVLDSPPRVSNSISPSISSHPKNNDDQSKNSQSATSNSKSNKDQLISSQPVSSSSKTNKNKLPPWLMMKRIA